MTPLQEIRIKKGITQQQLSDESGIKLTTIQKLENGANSLTSARFDTIIKLSKALKITAEEMWEAYQNNN